MLFFQRDVIIEATEGIKLYFNSTLQTKLLINDAERQQYIDVNRHRSLKSTFLENLIWHLNILACQGKWQKAQWCLWYGTSVEAVCCHRWSLVLYLLGRDLYQAVRFVFGRCDKVGYEWFDFFFCLRSFDKCYFLLL